MSLMRILGFERVSVPPSPSVTIVPMPQKPPAPRLVCPNCTHEDFALGGITFGFTFDGHVVTRHETGAQLCCNHCGVRIAVNRDGAYKPATDALPGLWAVAAKQAEERERLAQNGPEKPVPPRPSLKTLGLRRGPGWERDERNGDA